MTAVVLVCSPFTVATAKGSGKPKWNYEHIAKGCGEVERVHLTKDVALVESIGGDN